MPSSERLEIRREQRAEDTGRAGHPHPVNLLRFLRGETSRTENRGLVLHLLHGCPECSQVTRKLWRSDT